MIEHLPPHLRESQLPWEPFSEDQAAVPRPYDAWRARVGHLRFGLFAEDDDFPTPGRFPKLSFALEVLNSIEDRQLGRWEGLTLEAACAAARALCDVIIGDVVDQVRRAR